MDTQPSRPEGESQPDSERSIIDEMEVNNDSGTETGDAGLEETE